MPVALWVSLGVLAVAGTVAWLLAARMKKGLVPFASRSSASSLPGPHWQDPNLLPQRYVSRHVVEPTGSMSVCHLSKTEAEDLLDWLEANGVPNRELIQVDDNGFVVRYW